MNSMRVSFGVGLLVSLCDTSFASSGVVSVHGSIVQTPCSASTQGEGVMLHGCPASARGNSMRARGVESVLSVRSLDGSAVHVKLIVERAEDGGLFSQQYALIDSKGKPVTSGKYLMTLTPP